MQRSISLSNGLEHPCLKTNLCASLQLPLHAKRDGAMKERNLLFWILRALVYIIICSVVIASLCAFKPSARIAALVGSLVGVFLLPMTYRLKDGTMTALGDVLFAATTLLFVISVTIFTPTICVEFAMYGNTSCNRVSGSCLILMIPGLLIAFFMWLWFRLR